MCLYVATMNEIKNGEWNLKLNLNKQITSSRLFCTGIFNIVSGRFRSQLVQEKALDNHSNRPEYLKPRHKS